MKYRLAKLVESDDLSQRWYVAYHYMHPESKKMQRFKVYISNKLLTKTARRHRADDIIRNINAKLRKGWSPFQNEKLKSASEAIDMAMNLKGATLGKRTRWTYESVIRQFQAYLRKNKLDKVPIEEIDSAVALTYFDEMLLNSKISKRTYNNRLAALKTIFNVLQKRLYINFNPFITIEKLKVSEPEITAYTADELAIMRDTLPKYDYQLYVISQLIYYCFLRPAEIVRLQFRDVLMDNELIVIPGKKAKNGKTQVIILPDHFRENIQDWNLNYPQDYYIFSSNLQPGKTEVAPTRIAGAWRKYADKYGIKKNIYDLKHTGNGNAFDQGFNARDIQLQNRHSSLDETQKYLNKFRRIPSGKFKSNFNGY